MARVEELYFISMAARELGLHPQTLRKYERLGLVQPSRKLGACACIPVTRLNGCG